MNVEDVPEQAENLGWSAHLELREAINILSKALDNIEESAGNYDLVLSMVDKVRKKLNNSDLIIEDLQAILKGLHNYHIGEKNVSEGRSIVDPGGNTTTTPENIG